MHATRWEEWKRRKPPLPKTSILVLSLWSFLSFLEPNKVLWVNIPCPSKFLLRPCFHLKYLMQQYRLWAIRTLNNEIFGASRNIVDVKCWSYLQNVLQIEYTKTSLIWVFEDKFQGNQKFPRFFFCFFYKRKCFLFKSK